MRTTMVTILITAGLLLLAGCLNSDPPRSAADHTPVNHTLRLDDYLDTSGFVVDGCTSEAIAEGINALNCSKKGLEEKFNCASFLPASKYYGGLTPKETILECINLDMIQCTDGLLGGGCVRSHEGKQTDDLCDRIFNRLIGFNGSEWKEIGNEKGFVDHFAPVETPKEALAFAVALSGDSPRVEEALGDLMSRKCDVKLPVNVSTIDVQEADEGFILSLYHHELCGSPPFPIYSITYLVTKKGEVKEIGRKAIVDDYPCIEEIYSDNLTIMNG